MKSHGIYSHCNTFDLLSVFFFILFLGDYFTTQNKTIYGTTI